MCRSVLQSAHKQSLGKGCISSPFSLHTRRMTGANVYVHVYKASLDTLPYTTAYRLKFNCSSPFPNFTLQAPLVLKFPADSVAFSRPLSIITVLQTSSLYQNPKCTCRTGAQPPIHIERKLCSNCTPLWSQVLLVLSGLQDNCLEEEHCLREQADFKEASMMNPVPQEPEAL